jgi:16S rRNA processing protein RimM
MTSPAAASPAPRWAVGKVLSPRGLRGELKLRLFRASPAYLAAERIRIGGVVYRVRRLSWADTLTPVVQLDGVADRSAAEALVGQTLELDASWFEPGEGPVEQLLGARAVDADSGQPLGLTVEDLDSNGVQALLVLRGAGGREHLVPWVEALVPRVVRGAWGGLDVHISAIPGLLDHDEPEAPSRPDPGDADDAAPPGGPDA